MQAGFFAPGIDYVLAQNMATGKEQFPDKSIKADLTFWADKGLKSHCRNWLTKKRELSLPCGVIMEKAEKTSSLRQELYKIAAPHICEAGDLSPSQISAWVRERVLKELSAGA